MASLKKRKAQVASVIEQLEKQLATVRAQRVLIDGAIAETTFWTQAYEANEREDEAARAVRESPEPELPIAAE